MKNSLSVERGMMLFNSRVLAMGEIDDDLDNETLAERLRFNMIFRSNSDELFEKYHGEKVIGGYLEDLRVSNENICQLTESLLQLREVVDFEARLTTFRRLADGLTSYRINFSDIDDVIAWTSGKLYYLTPCADGSVIVTSADMKGHIYSSPFEYQTGDDIIAWRTVDCIIDYLNTVYGPTIAVKPTISRDYCRLVKLEFKGNIELLPADMRWLDPETIVIENDELYLNDLEQLLQEIIDNDYGDDEDEDDDEIFDFGFDLESEDDDDDEDYDDDEMEDDDDEEDLDEDDEDDEEEDLLIDERLIARDFVEEDLIEEDFTLDSIFEHDWLMEYPYARFDAYLRFLRLVSINPRVKRLSLCLYRIGDNPIIFYLLRESSRRGIEVIVNIESAASGELINDFWSRELRKVGVTVINHGHGIHKVHAKLTSVVFDDGRQLAQIGTGNYHWKTATQYNDLSLYTADKSICEAVEAIFRLMMFETVDRRSIDGKVLLTDHNAVSDIVELIRSQARLGPDGFIVIKANSFDGGTDIADELELAAEAGCQIELIIRGCCTWVPKRLNDNITIKSVVWEQLEHARVYQFGRGEDAEIYMGSLDPVARKLNHRIEVMVKVTDSSTVSKLREYLSAYLNDEIGNVWKMIRKNGKVDYELI